LAFAAASGLSFARLRFAALIASLFRNLYTAEYRRTLSLLDKTQARLVAAIFCLFPEWYALATSFFLAA
jgi:hypothetical protein